VHQSVINPLIERELPAPGDRDLHPVDDGGVVAGAGAGAGEQFFKIGLLSRLTEQVTFVLIRRWC